MNDIDKRINKKDLSVEELVHTINNYGYSTTAIERSLELEFGILDKWISGEEDISCVGLSLLRLIAMFPWLIKVAENNYVTDIPNILKTAIQNEGVK